MKNINKLYNYLIKASFVEEAIFLNSFYKTATSLSEARKSFESQRFYKRVKDFLYREYLKVNPGKSFDDILNDKELVEEFEGNIADYTVNIEEDFLDIITSLDIEDSEKGLSLLWLIKILIYDSNLKFNYRTSDIYRKTTKLEMFFQYKDIFSRAGFETDLFKIKSLDELVSIIEQAKPAITDYQNRKDYADAEKGTEKIYDGTKYAIIAVHNKGAACQHGKGTDWCTAAPGLDYFENYYRKYSPLFIITDKETGERFQFSYSSQMYNDIDDNPIDKAKFNEINSILLPLIKDKYPIVYLLKNNKNIITLDLFKKLLNNNELNVNDSIEIKKDIAAKENVSKDLLKYLIENEINLSLLATIASNKSATSDVLEALVDKIDINNSSLYRVVIGYITRNPNVTIEILNLLRESEEYEIRKAVASSPYATAEILDLMKDDESGPVIEQIFLNSNTSKETRSYLEEKFFNL